jgi:hypothetical protein
MSAPTMNGKRSAFPATVDDLLPDARALAERTGEVPSVRALTRELRIGAPKAGAVREALLQGTGAAGPDAAAATATDAPEPSPTVEASTLPTARPDTPPAAVRVRTGRGWAYLGALLGGAVSVAANVAHSYVPPADAGAHWSPQPGAVVGAVFWPVALFVAVEIFARVAWPRQRRWTALRFCGLLPVAAVAAIVSYRHLSGLLGFYGEDPLTVVIGPLAVDGLMVMATGALVAIGRRTAGGEQ